MTLADYLAQHRITFVAFAESCGVHQTTILRIAKGAHMPRRKLATAIVDATAGAVSLAELYAPNDQSEAA